MLLFSPEIPQAGTSPPALRTPRSPSTPPSIPASHKPIITAIPEIIQECEPAVFQVSGVKGPLQGYIWSSVEGSEMVNIIFDKDSFTWIPNYPVGTRIHINIWVNSSQPRSWAAGTDGKASRRTQRSRSPIRTRGATRASRSASPSTLWATPSHGETSFTHRGDHSLIRTLLPASPTSTRTLRAATGTRVRTTPCVPFSLSLTIRFLKQSRQRSSRGSFWGPSRPGESSSTSSCAATGCTKRARAARSACRPRSERCKRGLCKEFGFWLSFDGNVLQRSNPHGTFRFVASS